MRRDHLGDCCGLNVVPPPAGGAGIHRPLKGRDEIGSEYKSKVRHSHGEKVASSKL